MIEFYKTQDGATQKVSACEPGCWVNVCAPNAEERTWLTDTLDIPPEFLISALDEEESSHIESEDGQTLIIVDLPYAQRNEENTVYTTFPVGIIITPTNILTVSLKESHVIREFTEGKIKDINTQYRTKFVFQILLRMATRFLQHLRQIDRRSNDLQRKLRRSMRNKEIVALLDLQTSLVYFQTSLKSNEITLEKITKSRCLKMYEEDQELLEDVMIEIRQAIEMTNIQRSVLSATTDAFSSVISNNLNQVMKILTSITIVMALPTMVFSFFGMNVGATAGALPMAQTVWPALLIAFFATLLATIILFVKKMFK